MTGRPDATALGMRAHELEEPLQSLRGTVPDEDAARHVEVRQGRLGVLVVAAHGVPHWRGSDWKRREPFTAAAAWQAAELVGASTLVLRGILPEDANFDADGVVKRTLAQVVRDLRPGVILDLHGAESSRAFEIALGTRRGASLLGREWISDEMIAAFVAEGLRAEVIADGAFSAANPRTICAYASRTLGVPAVQVEINRELRRPRRTPEKYAALVFGLAEGIARIAARAELDAAA